ncbi:MAG: hypothetical protein KY461_16045, partial [Actinobacteria bacterium]|nr:hypothetical protein [Actinomycetota bacterium]
MAKKQMSDEHKAALAKGRAQGRAVRDYLEAIEEGSKPGRRLSPDEMRAKVESLHQQIEDEDNAAKR